MQHEQQNGITDGFDLPARETVHLSAPVLSLAKLVSAFLPGKTDITHPVIQASVLPDYVT